MKIYERIDLVNLSRQSLVEILKTTLIYFCDIAIEHCQKEELKQLQRINLKIRLGFIDDMSNFQIINEIIETQAKM